MSYRWLCGEATYTTLHIVPDPQWLLIPAELSVLNIYIIFLVSLLYRTVLVQAAEAMTFSMTLH